MDEDLTTMDDTGLAARMAAGDARAVAVLYDRYATPAFSLALKLAGDPQRAAEVVQRAFQGVWADARRFDAQGGRFATWLLSIVNYLATGAPLLSPVSERDAPGRLPAPVLRPVPVRVTCRHD